MNVKTFKGGFPGVSHFLSQTFEANQPYLQAKDARTKAAGKASVYKKVSEETSPAMRSMRELTQELDAKEKGAEER